MTERVGIKVTAVGDQSGGDTEPHAMKPPACQRRRRVPRAPVRLALSESLR